METEKNKGIESRSDRTKEMKEEERERGLISATLLSCVSARLLVFRTVNHVQTFRHERESLTIKKFA